MTVKRVNPAEAAKLVEEEGYLLLDVRAISEFEEERATPALNVPFLHKTPDGMVPNDDFERVVKAVAPGLEQGMVTHCAMGGRSLRAAQALVAMGYENVVDLRGGFSSEKDDSGQVLNAGWKDSALPVESGPGSPRAYALVAKQAGVDVDTPAVEPPPVVASDPMNRFASDKRTVVCVKYGQSLPGLKRRPYPGELGVRLFENVSALAWNDWVEHSKILINEYRIVSTDLKSMKMLYEQCENFFFGEGVDRPAEFVPPSS